MASEYETVDRSYLFGAIRYLVIDELAITQIFGKTVYGRYGRIKCIMGFMIYGDKDDE